MSSGQMGRVRERVPTGRRGRPSKSMIAAAMERPFCAYLHKICLNNRLEGHKYCIDHIMNDKTAPYRQCTYVHSTSGRRCTKAAHKVDRRTSPLCHYHRTLRLNAPTHNQLTIAETVAEMSKNSKRVLFQELSHHRSTEPIQPQGSFWLEDSIACPSQKLNATLATFNVKRFASDLDPPEMLTAEEFAARHNNADSDTESVDNSYDIFKNASVYTDEEVYRCLRDKMVHLRRLYIEQFSSIQYMIKERRLRYVQSQRIEDETYGDIYSFRNYPNSPDYKELKTMLRYHKICGSDALLLEQTNGNRVQIKQESGTGGDQPKTQSANQQPSLAVKTLVLEKPVNICIFSKTIHKCDKPSLPLSPYCSHHILYDNKQLLFRPCAGGIPPCLTPVVSHVRKNRCCLHTMT